MLTIMAGYLRHLKNALVIGGGGLLTNHIVGNYADDRCRLGLQSYILYNVVSTDYETKKTDEIAEVRIRKTDEDIRVFNMAVKYNNTRIKSLSPFNYIHRLDIYGYHVLYETTKLVNTSLDDCIKWVKPRAVSLKLADNVGVTDTLYVPNERTFDYSIAVYRASNDDNENMAKYVVDTMKNVTIEAEYDVLRLILPTWAKNIHNRLTRNGDIKLWTKTYEFKIDPMIHA